VRTPQKMGRIDAECIDPASEMSMGAAVLAEIEMP
jgi:hypothetical protein